MVVVVVRGCMGEVGGLGWAGCRCGGGRLQGDVAMETHRGVGEAVAVGGDDSTLAAREKLTAIRHPGTAGHLWGEPHTHTVAHWAPGGPAAVRADPAGLTRVYLVELRALDEVDRRFALLALQPEYVISIAPAQDGRPLDVCAVHAANT